MRMRFPLLGPAQDALVHHIAHGVGEERENVNPHLLPSFDEAHPDVARLGVQLLNKLLTAGIRYSAGP